MKTFKTLLICAFLALGFTACEQDDLLQEEELLITANSTTSVDAIIIGNRNKLKERPQRNYKSVIIVDDPTNSVTSAVVQYTPLEGDNPFPEPFEMQVSTIRKSIRKMQKTQSMLNDTSLFPVGTPFQQTASLYNELGEQVGDVSETWVTAQDNDGTDLNKVTAQEVSQNVISISTKVHSDQRDNIGEIYAQVELYGRILIKGQPLEMERTLPEEDTDNGNTLTATTTVQLQELTGGDIVIPGDELMVSITVNDIQGETIDEDFFIVVVGEEEEPYEVKNVKHRTRPTGTIRIKGTINSKGWEYRLNGPHNPTNLKMTIPEGNEDGSPLVLDFELQSNEQDENKFRFNAIFPEIANYPVGSEYDAIFEILDEDSNVISTQVHSITVENVPTTVNNATVYVFGEHMYVETRVTAEVGLNIERVNAVISPQEGQDFEPFEVEMMPAATQGNGPAVRFESVSFTNPTFVGATDAQQNVLAQMTVIDTDGNTVLASEEEIQLELLEGITRNPKHILRPNNTQRIRMRLKTPIAQEVSYATMVAPGFGPDGSDLDVVLERFDDGADTGTTTITLTAEYTLVYADATSQNEVYTAPVTFFNSAAQLIGGEVVDIEVINNNETPVSSDIQVESVQLLQNEDGETFSFLVDLSGQDINTIGQVAVFLTPQDGGSEADPEDFILNTIEETPESLIYSNTFVTFGDPNSVVDMQYLAEITLIDGNGEEIDYLEFDIIGEE